MILNCDHVDRIHHQIRLSWGRHPWHDFELDVVVVVAAMGPFARKDGGDSDLDLGFGPDPRGIVRRGVGMEDCQRGVRVPGDQRGGDQRDEKNGDLDLGVLPPILAVPVLSSQKGGGLQLS
jgi:hypothetical protein